MKLRSHVWRNLASNFFSPIYSLNLHQGRLNRKVGGQISQLLAFKSARGFWIVPCVVSLPDVGLLFHAKIETESAKRLAFSVAANFRLDSRQTRSDN
jgi:hypothetical protein